jgi:two-component system, NtrC family, response regulator AtoC
MQILIVDDDREFIEDFKILLPKGSNIISTSTIDDARKVIAKSSFQVVFLDVDLGTELNGLDLLSELKTECPYLSVIMVTADHNIETIVKAMQLGASDYVGKSPDMKQLQLSINRALADNRLQKKADLLETELIGMKGKLVGNSQVMISVKEEIERLASVSSNVLVTGQSGTGKELVARGIHKLSARNDQAFIAINGAALSKDLFESELFGHEKGAFTGAISRRIGKFELVESGTLFLDEITEIPVELQAKLLRVLQEREFERVGGDHLIEFKGRLITSSNRDMNKAIEDGLLREDLYFRLNVTSVNLPPLVERKEDIPELVEHFITRTSIDMKKKIEGISDEALRMLFSYQWPGNVRELANCIENAIVHCDDTVLELHHLNQLRLSGPQTFKNYEETKKQVLLNFKREYVSILLKKNDGNISKTARQMDISRQGLLNIMDACGILDQKN